MRRRAAAFIRGHDAPATADEADYAALAVGEVERAEVSRAVLKWRTLRER